MYKTYILEFCNEKVFILLPFICVCNFQPYSDWVDYPPVHQGYYSLPRHPADARQYHTHYSQQPPLSQVVLGMLSICL